MVRIGSQKARWVSSCTQQKQQEVFDHNFGAVMPALLEDLLDGNWLLANNLPVSGLNFFESMWGVAGTTFVMMWNRVPFLNLEKIKFGNRFDDWTEGPVPHDAVAQGYSDLGHIGTRGISNTPAGSAQIRSHQFPGGKPWRTTRVSMCCLWPTPFSTVVGELAGPSIITKPETAHCRSRLSTRNLLLMLDGNKLMRWTSFCQSR